MAGNRVGKRCGKGRDRQSLPLSGGVSRAREHLHIAGRFGAYLKAPQESRVRCTTLVREQAEIHEFAWAYWELASGFGVYDPDAKAWREDLLRALIP